MMATEVRHIAHPTDKSNKAVCVVRNGSKILLLLFIGLTATAVKDHASVAANGGQWRAQFMRQIHLLVTVHLKHCHEHVFFFREGCNLFKGLLHLLSL